MYDLIIIGAGTAGLTAAIYAKRSGMNCVVFESDSPGGKIVNSPKIDNYPGLPGISGFDYSMALLNQVLNLGVEIIYDKIIRANLSCKVKELYTSEKRYESLSVIISNGASRKKLGCKGENEFEGKGISYCATCDGNFFRNKDVSVIGGGDTALEDSIYLSNLCKTVYVFCKNDFTARNDLIDKASSISNIKLIRHSNLTEVIGESSVEKISIQTDGLPKEYNVSAVFGAIGLTPDNKIFGEDLSLNENGYIVTDSNCKTNIDGIFAAGDTRDKILRQLVTAASDGAIAATEAFKYLKKLDKEEI